MSKGLLIFPYETGIPVNPCNPVPRQKFINTVSALSSA